MPASQTRHRAARAEPGAALERLQPSRGKGSEERPERGSAVPAEHLLQVGESPAGGSARAVPNKANAHRLAELDVHGDGPLGLELAYGCQAYGERRQRMRETEAGHDSSLTAIQSETVHELAF